MKKLSLMILAFPLSFVGKSASGAVTAYGILDVGPTYVSNAGGNSQLSLQDGLVQQSRWGLGGTEDLGGEYRAGFRLESGFSADSGRSPGGLAFSRKAFVTMSGPFGMFIMGRDASALSDVIAPYISSMLVYGPGYPSVHPGSYDHVFGTQYNSLIKYSSPDLNGFTFRSSFALGGKPGSIVKSSALDVGLNYVAGGLSIGLGGQRLYDVNGGDVLLQPQANPFGTSGRVGHQDNIAVGASYDFGHLLIHGAITQAHIYGSGTVGRTYELGLKSSIAPSWVLGLDYSRTLVKKRAGMGILSASADYFLSKRTDVYFSVAYEEVGGTNAAGDPLVAQMFTFAPSSNRSQASLHFGVRHFF